jgi:hypothetical protein
METEVNLNTVKRQRRQDGSRYGCRMGQRVDRGIGKTQNFFFFFKKKIKKIK